MATSPKIHPLIASSSTAPPSSSQAFLDALEEAVDTALEVRRATLVAMGAVPTDSGAWLEAMTDPRAAVALGKLLMVAGKNAEWARAMVELLTKTLKDNAPGATFVAFTEGYADGLTEIEMTCSCGSCHACEARAEVGDDKARVAIRAALRPPTERPAVSRLVGKNGRPLVS